MKRLFVFKEGQGYLLQADMIFLADGHAETPGWIRVNGGRIEAVGGGPAGEPDGWELVRLDKLILVPGLIDAHVHLQLDPGGLPELQDRIRLASGCGLAAVRDGGDRNCTIAASRALIEKDMFLAASGAALFAPGRYGAFLGRAVAGRDEMRLGVRDMAELGADQIKVLASGPVSLKAFGSVGPSQFEPDDLIYLVALAREFGLPVMAHANGPESVRMCIEAGVASVEHGYFMGRDMLKMAADRGVAWSPTIEPLGALARVEGDPVKRALIDRIIAGQVEQLAYAKDIGLNAIPGTDAGSPGNPAGPGLFREFGWWIEAGYSPRDILNAATEKAADLLKISGIGRLAPGRLAFLTGFPMSGGSPDISSPPVFVARPESGLIRRMTET